MKLFKKPEVNILKESSDAKEYLKKLQALQQLAAPDTDLANQIKQEIAMTKAGIDGEDKILFELKNSGMDLVVLHDLYIESPAGNGAQIDFLVITPYVNVFIESKNLLGNIEITDKGDFIRTNLQGVREGIYNPITQNERHRVVFKECRLDSTNAIKRYMINKYFDYFNKSLVVLTNSKTIVDDKHAPKEVREKVIRADQLVAAIQKMDKQMKSAREYKSNKKEMLVAGNRYLSLNRDDRKDYIQKFQRFVDQYNTERPEGTPPISITISAHPTKPFTCPRCGKELVLRTVKRGINAGNQIYGCSGFPECRFILNLNELPTNRS